MLTFLVVFVTVYFWSALPLLMIQATFKGAVPPSTLAQLLVWFYGWRLSLSLTAAMSYVVLQ